MASISTTDARGLYTKMLIAVYAQRRKPASFFRSMFTKVISDTLELSIEVQRGTQMIAVDVERGTEGNRNTFNKSTEKIFIPPFYKEFFNITDIDLYDRLFIDAEVDAQVIAKFIRTAAQKIGILQDKIERATEKMCADVLLTGVAQLNSGTNINYGRKAASLVDLGAGNYWATTTIDPYDQIQTDIQFIRDNGLVSDTTFMLCLGATAYHDLLLNPQFKARQSFFNLKLDEIAPPKFDDVVGQVFHGQMSVGPYRVNVFTYPDTYKDRVTGAITPYMDPKKYILTPMNTEYVLGYAANPQLISDPAPAVAIQKGEWIIYDYIDPRFLSHTYNIMSSPLAVPVAIDTTVTRKVVA
jgi:hypothetical protein